MMKLILPALLLAACGDNLHPDEDQLGGNAETDPTESPDVPPDPTDPPDDPPPRGDLFAGFFYEPSDCVDHSVRIHARYGYPDGTPVPNAICRFSLGDGTVIAETPSTSDTQNCFIVYPFPEPELLVFTVIDTDTGAVASHQEVLEGPETFTVALDATSDGLSIAWDARTEYDGVPNIGSVLISITPSENVIVDDPAVFRQPIGAVRVTQPGTYTVRVGASIGFADVGGCGASAEQQVTVTTCVDTSHAH